MKSPLIPWEIIERVVDHSGDHPETLRSVSRTCRQLCPRSQLVMFSEVDLKSRDRVSSFVDFLQVTPRLAPLVRSIVVPPTAFGPSLLYLLPNLSEIRCTPWEHQNTHPALALHSISLACLGRLGSHIQTLHLLKVSFPTPAVFARVLLALANVRNLVCIDVDIQAEGDQAVGEAVRRRLSESVQLKTLVIDYQSLTRGGSDASVGALLFDPDLAPSTVENLTLTGGLESGTLPLPSHWPRLQTLVLQLQSFEWGNIANAAILLQDLRLPALTELEVRFELDSAAGLQVTGELLSYSKHQSQVYQDLEDALLRVSQSRLVCVVKAPLRAGSCSFWMQEFGKYLPGLFGRGALIVKPDQPVLAAGHEARLMAVVVSPDGKWVASGSDDSTIILWDTNGRVARRWVAHGYKSVWSLAFSPNSRNLVSAGRDGKVAIWDLGQDVQKVSALEGHTGTVESYVWSPVEGHTTSAVSCAWSPDGNTIATGSWSETARLWDAHTFRQLRVFDMPGHGHVRSVAFSSDGRWLCSKSPRDYWIWEVGSGTLHKTVRPAHDTDVRGTDIPAAFYAPTMRLAVAFSPVAVEIWDVSSESGGRLFVLEQGGWVNDVSFSSDGKLLLAVLEHRAAKIWDADSGVELFQLQGHTRGVSAACFSSCGGYIASASWDTTVRLWRTSDGSCVAKFCEHDQPVERVAFLLGGKTLVSATMDGAVAVRRLEDTIDSVEKY